MNSSSCNKCAPRSARQFLSQISISLSACTYTLGCQIDGGGGARPNNRVAVVDFRWVAHLLHLSLYTYGEW